jgi:hypothetical protein
MNVKLNRRTAIRPGIPTVYYINSEYTGRSPVGYIVLLCDCTNGGVGINLPPAGETTDCFVIKKIDSSTNTVPIIPFSGETIDGSASIEIKGQYTSLTLVTNGTDWDII